MRRPLLVALGAALLALILLFGFSAWLFSQNMLQAKQKSQERMSALAIYIAEYLRKDAIDYPFESNPEIFPSDYYEQQNQWLIRLTPATGLERAVITDSVGLAVVSSQSLITTGDDISPYLVDTSLFQKAALQNQPLFTAMTVIDGVHFQSLYYPFDLKGHRHMLVLDSDQNFIAYAEQFRTYLWFASLFLAALFALLTGGIFVLDRKFQQALTESRRNERLAFLGRTSAELAHELKNPLAIIKASVDVLRKKLDPERQEVAFGFLSEETMRLSRLIGNILGFSKDQALEHKPFQPRGALLELRESHRMAFPKVEWQINLASDLIFLGDRDSFQQIVDNLARNASHAMESKGTFTVTYDIFSSGPMAGRMLFSDSGPGLPKAIRSKMFEPFVSGSKTGTGLGLAIVKSLCERLGWSIALLTDAGRDGKPTCFSLTIPKSSLTQLAANSKIAEP